MAFLIGAVVAFLIAGAHGLTNPGIMYPHGTSPKVPPIGEIAATKVYKFFGEEVSKFFLSPEGTIGMGADPPYFSADTYTLPMPIAVSLIALFMTDHQYFPTIYVRVATDAPTLSNITGHITDKFAECADNFQPTEAAIFTYLDVNYGGYEDGDETPGTNTYQCIIATDNSNTYVLFHFGDVNWCAGEQNGGQNGMCSTPPPGHNDGCKAATVGFQSHDRTKYYNLPLSGDKEKLVTIDETSNVNEQGRFIYKVDGTKVLGPNCEEAPSQ